MIMRPSPAAPDASARQSPARAEPEPVRRGMFEELDHPTALRTAHQPVVERDAHDLGEFRPFLVHQVETVDHEMGQNSSAELSRWF